MKETYEEKVSRVSREIEELLTKNGLAIFPSISFVNVEKRAIEVVENKIIT